MRSHAREHVSTGSTIDTVDMTDAIDRNRRALSHPLMYTACVWDTIQEALDEGALSMRCGHEWGSQ